MNDIHKIYSNNFGISFKWKKMKSINNTQLIFRDTGMLLNKAELKKFLKCIENALENKKACNKCTHNSNCKSILLETPTKQVSFAVNYEELVQVEDLVTGTLFNIGLEAILDQLRIQKFTKD